MKKFYYIFVATAGLLLAGCANDDLIVENSNPEAVNAEMPILFSSVKKEIGVAEINNVMERDLDKAMSELLMAKLDELL